MLLFSLEASAASRERDFGAYEERETDWYFGGGYRDYYGDYGGYRDHYYGGGSASHTDRKSSPGQDECSRVEARGVPLADTLREAATELEKLGGFRANPSKPEVKLRQLVSFFSSEQQRTFLLSHCPQAVVLAVLLSAEADDVSPSNSSGSSAASVRALPLLRELLRTMATLRIHRAPIAWTGAPWEASLKSVQQRTGIVLFPTGGQQFEVEHVSPERWVIHPHRRCAGRRDLGNLQATPLATCLEKCQLHPLCRSATFWHWQPGGFGFEQRCFLSSSCTSNLATSDGAEGAVLFERRQRLEEETAPSQELLTPSGAAWAPRAGHRLVPLIRRATASCDLADVTGAGEAGGSSSSRSSGWRHSCKSSVEFWLLGGVGVDPFANTTATATTTKPAPKGWGDRARAAEGKEKGSRDKAGRDKPGRSKDLQSQKKTQQGAIATTTRKRPRKAQNVTEQSDVIQAYMSRHVELNGELPPLRSLPYGRLGDVWSSKDLGSSWSMASGSTPWGPRAFFSAVVVQSGAAVLVLGGIGTPKELKEAITPPPLPRTYHNDVWLGELDERGLQWRRLQDAAWTPRCAFQALVRRPLEDSDEELLVLGGRLEKGGVSSEVWSIPTGQLEGGSWQLLTPAAAWPARADFAATVGGAFLWILGGAGEDGRPLADVWRSRDGAAWHLVQAAAPWGPRVGAVAAATTATPQAALLLAGGFAYPDGSEMPVLDRPQQPSSPLWLSPDGVSWELLNSTSVWSPSRLHGALVVAPCGGASSSSCAFIAGGVTPEGYFDNTVHRVVLPEVNGSLDHAEQLPPPSPQPTGSSVDSNPHTQLFLLLTMCALSLASLILTAKRFASKCLGLCALCAVGVGFIVPEELMSLVRLLRQGFEQRECELTSELALRLSQELGFGQLSERLSQLEILLRLASKEPQLGYGSWNSYYDGYRGAKDGSYGSYGTGRDYYDDFGWNGLDIESPGAGTVSLGEIQKRELALLPTTQSLSCRSPRCDRNATTCASSAPRSLLTPYGCCSDYMLIMLSDVAGWLESHNIPYFVTYGTLLGAVREGDILPWTQDMDLVVDRSHWVQLQRGLEGADFFGGRRYAFGVDQWEERVSRVCADWEGFATSVIGGSEGDRLSRATDFHLDVYASDWWQIIDMHLIDCVEPLGKVFVQIRGRNFSAPARPRACLEKLYGVEWRVPKHALSGVN